MKEYFLPLTASEDKLANTLLAVGVAVPGMVGLSYVEVVVGVGVIMVDVVVVLVGVVLMAGVTAFMGVGTMIGVANVTVGMTVVIMGTSVGTVVGGTVVRGLGGAVVVREIVVM